MSRTAVLRAQSATTNAMRLALAALVVVTCALLAGCQAIEPVAPLSSDEGATAQVQRVESTASGENAGLPVANTPVRTSLSSAPDAIVAPFATNANVDPSPEEAAVAALLGENLIPVRLVIAEARLDIPVEPLGWETIRIDGNRTTRWRLPEGVAGWHVDSARPGEPGNIVLSGRQLDGDVFAPIAQNAVQPGQLVLLIDSAGNEYRYRVDEVSEPLPILGDDVADAAAAAFIAQTVSPVLTLLTGWPDFTTTHYIFVVAVIEP